MSREPLTDKEAADLLKVVEAYVRTSERRHRLAALVLVGVALLFPVVYSFFPVRWTLECSRATGECTVRSYTLIGTEHVDERWPVTGMDSAELLELHIEGRSRSYTTYRLAIDDGARLHEFKNVVGEQASDWAAAVNGFISDPAQPSVRLVDDDTQDVLWRTLFMGVPALVMAYFIALF